MKIQLRAVIEFANHDDFRIEGGLTFDGFLPLVENAKPMSFANTGLTATLIADPSKHLADWEREAVEKGKIDSHRGGACSGLYVLLDGDVEPELAEALSEGRIIPEAKELGQKVIQILKRIHLSLIEFARNEEEQYWLSDPLRPRPEADRTVQHELDSYDTRLRTPRGWRILEVEAATIQPATVHCGPSGINQQTWNGFCQTVSERDYRARAHRRLLANANALFDSGDFRSAVVEAIAAWETVLAGDGPTILSRYQAQLTAKDWEDVIERAGLRASSRLFLAMVSPSLPDLQASAESLLEAIEVRNQIVHKGRRRFEYEEVRRLLGAVRTVILACEIPPRADEEATSRSGSE